MPFLAPIDPSALVIASAALQSAAAVDDRVVLPPVWRRRPTAAQIADAYPSEAAADGIGGQAAMVCEIEPDSTLSHCAVGDPPKGYGFGAAALSLVSYFRIRPQTIGGEAMVAGRVVIPIRFDPPAGAKPVQALWTSSPTAKDVRAALPKRVVDSGQGGVGTMRCTVSGGLLGDCRPANGETDPLGRAAVKLAAKFQIAPAFANGRPTEGAIFDIAVLFDAGKTPADVPVVLPQPPLWLRFPTAAQKDASFPDMAKSRGVSTLVLAETCLVQPDGGLGECRVTGEEPVGVGGAQAAIRLANGYQTTTWTPEGRSTTGAKVDLSFTLHAPIVEAKAPAAPAAARAPAKRPAPRR